MKRNIKFRAWLPMSATMVYNNEFNKISGNEIFKSGSGELWGSWRISNESSIHMQFIGLLDKNKNEIYEGDILNFSTKEGTKHTLAIYYIDREAMFCMYGMGGTKISELIRKDDDCEIIGNIYQNPEILKQQTIVS